MENIFFNSVYLLEYKIFMQAVDLSACTISETYIYHVYSDKPVLEDLYPVLLVH